MRSAPSGRNDVGPGGVYSVGRESGRGVHACLMTSATSPKGMFSASLHSRRNTRLGDRTPDSIREIVGWPH